MSTQETSAPEHEDPTITDDGSTPDQASARDDATPEESRFGDPALAEAPETHETPDAPETPDAHEVGGDVLDREPAPASDQAVLIPVDGYGEPRDEELPVHDSVSVDSVPVDESAPAEDSVRAEDSGPAEDSVLVDESSDESVPVDEPAEESALAEEAVAADESVPVDESVSAAAANDNVWHDLQGRFVDDPAAAVREAGDLVEQALSDLRGRAESGSTEDLRTAFRRYRDLHAALG